MKTIVHLLVSGAAVWAAARFIDGVYVDGPMVAIFVAIVLGFLNAILKPILIILTLPINILTLGLFTFVINTVMVVLAGKIVSGFFVTSFSSALWFSIALSIVNWLLHHIIKDEIKE